MADDGFAGDRRRGSQDELTVPLHWIGRELLGIGTTSYAAQLAGSDELGDASRVIPLSQ
jgi:hypothetical protein